MPESPSDPDKSKATAITRGVRWDALAAIIAALVGLLALIVAGYTAYIQRYTAALQKQQVEAQVWPYLLMGKTNAEGTYALQAINRGVGPVIVRSVQVLANGKPVQNWSALQRLFGFKPSGEVVTSTLNQMVLSPGEKLRWVSFQNIHDINAFVADWARFHVEVRVCYTSTLGDAWTTLYRPGWPGSVRPKPVPACPKVPWPAQFAD